MSKCDRRWRDEIYCIELQANGRWAPINRYYKGIGINPNEHNHVWIDYDTLVGFALVEPLTVGKAKLIFGSDYRANSPWWTDGRHTGGDMGAPDTARVLRLYFYSDFNFPDASISCRHAYDARIDRLKRLVADPAEFAAALDPLANLHLVASSAA